MIKFVKEGVEQKRQLLLEFQEKEAQAEAIVLAKKRRLERLSWRCEYRLEAWSTRGLKRIKEAEETGDGVKITDAILTTQECYYQYVHDAGIDEMEGKEAYKKACRNMDGIKKGIREMEDWVKDLEGNVEALESLAGKDTD